MIAAGDAQMDTFHKGPERLCIVDEHGKFASFPPWGKVIGTTVDLANYRSFPFTMNLAPKPSAPEFSVRPGSYLQPQEVELSCETPDTVIRFTTDGSDPDTDDPVYAEAIEISETTLLKARAFKDGLEPSLVRNSLYKIGPIVAAGDLHTLLVKTDGSLYTFGRNYLGQLGSGTTSPNETVPLQIMSSGVRAASGGDSFSVLLMNDGTVWTAGNNNHGQLGRSGSTSVFIQIPSLDNVASIAAGNSHVLALKNDGTIWSWGGTSTIGQAGRTTSLTTPAQITSFGDVVAVKAGGDTSVAITEDGSVWCWGEIEYLEGDGVPATATPRRCGYVSEVSDMNVSDFYIKTLRQDGTLLTSSGGILFEKLNITPRFIAISLSLGLTADRHLYSYGNSSATRVPILKTVAQFSEGSNHRLTSEKWDDDIFLSWGTNNNGQLGLGDLNNRVNPVPINLGSYLDSDNDGLNSLQEYIAGTKTNSTDTNGDGVSDYAAVSGGLEAVSLDSDSDGLSNADEFLAGTNPFRADSDGDGVNDGADWYPTDPSLWETPGENPSDSTGPVLTLTLPEGITVGP